MLVRIGIGARGVKNIVVFTTFREDSRVKGACLTDNGTGFIFLIPPFYSSPRLDIDTGRLKPLFFDINANIARTTGKHMADSGLWNYDCREEQG